MLLTYAAPPVCSKFLMSDAKMRVLMGPVGSGKSVTSCFEIIRRASMQAPSPDGIRRTRCAVVRQTVRQLRDTTLKTFLDWFPPGVYGEFMKTSYTYYFKYADVECEIMFRALDRPDDVANLNSLELTFAWFNECRDIKPDILDAMAKRVGRYPSKRDAPVGVLKWPTWSGMWGDTNPPVMESWWWAMMEGINPDDGITPINNGWDVFKQPSGRSAQAENIENLPDDYYDTTGLSKDYIRVFIDGEYAHSPSGSPVYQGFKINVHVAPKPLMAIRSDSHPLLIGVDTFLSPAAVICQVDAKGRVMVLDEVVGKEMGAERFINTMLRPKLVSKFRGLKVAIIIDPAGMQRSQTDESTVKDIYKKAGFQVVQKARLNNIQSRIDAVDRYLMKNFDGESAFLIDPGCLRLKSAMMGGYRYHEKEERIIKDKHSHVAEALQYAMLHISITEGGDFETVARPIVKKPSNCWV